MKEMSGALAKDTDYACWTKMVAKMSPREWDPKEFVPFMPLDSPRIPK